MRFRRRIAAVAVLAASIVAGSASLASAHPLGNFTINTSSSLVVRPAAIAIQHVVDMAEIPAFRERRAMDVDADGTVDDAEAQAYAASTCAAAAGRMAVTFDDRSVTVTHEGGATIEFPVGAGGLSTLRLTCRFTARPARALEDSVSTSVTFDDRNHPDALGWREVVAVGDGVTIVRSDVPVISETDALRSYPREDLPLDVRSASLTIEGGGPRLAVADAARPTIARGADGGVLASLVGRADLTPLAVAAMLFVALGVGAVHALGPGHGKTLIGAYLVAGGGSIRSAVGVGTAVSLMHTASVLALGGVVLTAERVFAPERVYPWLGLVAGGIAVVLGLALLRERLRPGASGRDGSHGHVHPHEHPDVDPHGHPHARAAGHVHDDAGGVAALRPLSSRALVALAFSGGALPSPTALVVFLGAVSLGRAALGLTLIAAFSLGLAAALIGVGVLAVRARAVADRRLSPSVLRVVPVVSAAAIVAMGAFVAVRGASQL